jgi:8-oxo-dGTP pyrophosphatase MutT (NUDIX family)
MNEDCFHLGAKALIMRPDGRVLLLKKNRKEIKDLWDLPGGRIQRNEQIVDALRREVLEETGFANLAEITHLMMVLTDIRCPLGESDVGLIFSVYTCQVNESPVQLSPEHISYVWVLPQEAEAMLAPNHPAELTRAVGRLGKVEVL